MKGHWVQYSALYCIEYLVISLIMKYSVTIYQAIFTLHLFSSSIGVCVYLSFSKHFLVNILLVNNSYSLVQDK